MNFVNSIIESVNQCPEYIGKGIVQLLIVTLGGVFVAWITTSLFGRRSEINAVEGALLKRKMDIYEELCGRLEALKSVVTIPEDVHEAAVKMLKEVGVAFNPLNSNQLLSIFDSPQEVTESFLELGKYIASKKLYYDHDVMIQTMCFQNYFAVFRRLLVMYEQEFVNAEISLEEKEVAAAERILTAELGMVLQDEFVEQMDKVITTMKQSFVNLNFNHRKQIEYNYDFFNSPDGPILGEMMNTKILKEREKITAVVTSAVALGMAGNIIARKKK